MSHLSDNDKALLAVAHAAAAADVDQALAREDIRRALADDGPLVATMLAVSALDDAPEMDREALVALAGHLLVRLMQVDGGAS